MNPAGDHAAGHAADPATDPIRPLDELQIVDFSTGIAGPYCT